MNIEIIKELAKLLKDEQLTVLEVEDDEQRIRIEKAPPTDKRQPNYLSTDTVTISNTPKEMFKAPDTELDFNDINTVKAPMVGVFYAAPAPDKEPYVKVGSKIKKGDVLCIVEAMKLMNEVVSECDGEIVDICVSDGDMVEFGQTLFKIF
ncbi:MAG: acetyl-CoA carboxylase biotin carboxyl carrier protein [Eubacteriales bacterium]